MNIFFRPAARPKADATLPRGMNSESPVECAGRFAASTKVDRLQTHAI